jgi:outer membrane protein OmpA-like peptidoglycan-associated protein
MKARLTLLWAAGLILTGCAGKAALPPIMPTAPELKLLDITQPEGEAHYVFCAACPDRTPKRLALAPAPVALVAPPALVAAPEKHAEPKPTGPITVLFSRGSAKLGNDSLKDLREVVSALPATARFTLIGHTDEVGSRKFNEQLARKRAGAVRDALLTLGISRARINAVGSRCCIDHPPTINPQARRADVVILIGALNVKP